MSDIISPNKDIMLSVASEHDHDMIVKISRALSVLDRVRILKSLLLRPKKGTVAGAVMLVSCFCARKTFPIFRRSWTYPCRRCRGISTR